MDLRTSEAKLIKDYFEVNRGSNKITFAERYVEVSQRYYFSELNAPSWINDIKKFLGNERVKYLSKVLTCD